MKKFPGYPRNPHRTGQARIRLGGRPQRLRAWRRCGRYLVSRAELLGLLVPVEPRKEAAARRETDAVLRRFGLE